MTTILILLAAYMGWRAIKVVQQIIASRRHLTSQQLYNYLRGGRHYAEADRARVSLHLGSCEACQRLMDDCIHGRTVEDSLLIDESS